MAWKKEHVVQFRACLLICLLAGSHVAQVDAARRSVNVFDRVGEADHFKRSMDAFVETAASAVDVPVPTNDDGCNMFGPWGHGTCQPAEYCTYHRSWMSFDRNKDCVLQAIVRPDEELVETYGENSAELMAKAEYFRTHANAARLMGMRAPISAVGMAGNAVNSVVPTPKPKLKQVAQAFHEDTIAEYLGSLRSVLPGKISLRNDEFSSVSLAANALNRTIDSIDVGMNSTALLRMVKSKVDFAKVLQVQANPSEDPAVLKQQLSEAIPGLSTEQIEGVMQKWTGWSNKTQQECAGDSECESQAMLRQRESSLRELDERVMSRMNEARSFLQLADGDGIDGISEALLAMEERLESEELSQEEVEGNPVLWVLLAIAVAAVICVTIFIFATACIFSIACWVVLLIIGAIMVLISPFLIIAAAAR